MWVGAYFQCLFFVFFQIFPSILSILFLGRSFFWRSTCEKDGKKMSRMWFENVCWQHVMMEPKNVVTQDLVQVLMTAWDEVGGCPSDTDMDGHFGLAKCKCFEPQVQLQQEAQCGTVEVLSWWRCIILAGSKPTYPVTIDSDQRHLVNICEMSVGTAARQTGFHSWCSTYHIFVRVFATPWLFSCWWIQNIDECPRWIGHWRAVQVRIGILQGPFSWPLMWLWITWMASYIAGVGWRFLDLWL